MANLSDTYVTSVTSELVHSWLSCQTHKQHQWLQNWYTCGYPVRHVCHISDFRIGTLMATLSDTWVISVTSKLVHSWPPCQTHESNQWFQNWYTCGYPVRHVCCISDFRIGTLMANLSDMRHYRVSAMSDLFIASVLWLGEIGSLMYIFYLSVMSDWFIASVLWLGKIGSLMYIFYLSVMSDWFIASVLWLGEIGSLMYSFYLRVALYKTVSEHLSLRYTLNVAATRSKQCSYSYFVNIYPAAWIGTQPKQKGKISHVCAVTRHRLQLLHMRHQSVWLCEAMTTLREGDHWHVPRACTWGMHTQDWLPHCLTFTPFRGIGGGGWGGGKGGREGGIAHW